MAKTKKTNQIKARDPLGADASYDRMRLHFVCCYLLRGKVGFPKKYMPIMSDIFELEPTGNRLEYLGDEILKTRNIIEGAKKILRKKGVM